MQWSWIETTSSDVLRQTRFHEITVYAEKNDNNRLTACHSASDSHQTLNISELTSFFFAQRRQHTIGLVTDIFNALNYEQRQISVS